jgi:hypothetical protein
LLPTTKSGPEQTKSSVRREGLDAPRFVEVKVFATDTSSRAKSLSPLIKSNRVVAHEVKEVVAAAVGIATHELLLLKEVGFGCKRNAWHATAN